MTTEEELARDFIFYGISIERQKEDGTTERIDPTTVKIKRIIDDKFYPIPLVKPEDWPTKRIEYIEKPL